MQIIDSTPTEYGTLAILRRPACSFYVVARLNVCREVLEEVGMRTTEPAARTLANEVWAASRATAESAEDLLHRAEWEWAQKENVEFSYEEYAEHGLDTAPWEYEDHR